MHNERCTSGSARGQTKPLVERLTRRVCPTQPYIWTKEGWLYLAIVLDLFSRRIVGWSMAPSLERTLVVDALQMAIAARNPSEGLIHHSDRGHHGMAANMPVMITKKHFNRDFYGLSKGSSIVFFIFSVISDTGKNPVDNFVTHSV